MPTRRVTVHVTATERYPSEERLLAALRAAGMSAVPARFSIATVGQEIPEAVLAGIEVHPPLRPGDVAARADVMEAPTEGG